MRTIPVARAERDSHRVQALAQGHSPAVLKRGGRESGLVGRSQWSMLAPLRKMREPARFWMKPDKTGLLGAGMRQVAIVFMAVTLVVFGGSPADAAGNCIGLPNVEERLFTGGYVLGDDADPDTFGVHKARAMLRERVIDLCVPLLGETPDPRVGLLVLGDGRRSART